MTDPRAGLPSASALEIVINCPGQPQLKATLNGAGIDQGDEYAARGTRIHKARETGSVLELENDEEIETYQTGLEYEKLLLRQWRSDKGILEEQAKEGAPELRLWLHHAQTLRPLASGQLDVHYLAPAVRDPLHALVLDFKSGWSPYVPPCERSWQLRFQALLLWKEYPTLQSIRVAFVKPKSRLDPGDTADYYVSDLEQSESLIYYHLWLAEQPGSPRRAGQHCRYCPCKTICPEAGAYALLPSVIARGMTPEKMDVKAAVDRLLPEDLVMIWERSTVITKILDEVKARLKGLPKEELDRLGLGFAKPRNLDPIINVRGAYDRCLQEVPEEKLWGCLSMKKDELKKTLMRELGWGEEAAKGWIRGQLEPFIEKKTAEAALIRK